MDCAGEPGNDADESTSTKVGITPCTLQVGRKDEFTVTVSKSGYQPAEVPVSTKVNAGGGAAFAGNVLVGGLVGMAADASTGAGLDHYPNPVEVDLVPLKPTRPTKSAPRAKSVPEG